MKFSSSVRRKAVAAALVLSATLATARADIYINGSDDGVSTSFTFRGSLTTTGVMLSSGNRGSRISNGRTPSNGDALVFAAGPVSLAPAYTVSVAPLKDVGFYSKPPEFDDFSAVVSGDFFGINGRDISLPANYVSGTEISGAMTFNVTGRPIDFDTPLALELENGLGTVYFNIPFPEPPAPPAPTTGAARADLQICKSFNRLKGDDVIDKNKATNKQTLVRKSRIFTTNTAKAALLLQNDGGTADVFRLRSKGDQFPRMKATARIPGGSNITADLKRGGYRTMIAPGASVRVSYQLKTNRYYAGVFRNGDRDDRVEFTFSGGGSKDNAAMLIKYSGPAGPVNAE